GLGISFTACSSSGDNGSNSGCSAYADQAPAQSVTVRIKNTGSLPFYFGESSGCGNTPLYSIKDANGQVLAQNTGPCSYTCGDLREHTAACTADCALPPIYRIDPGASYDVEWDGTTLETAAMPKSCYFEPDSASTSCSKQIVAPS